MSRIERHHTLFYRRAWQTLKQINGLANENLIYPGQVLRLH